MKTHHVGIDKMEKELLKNGYRKTSHTGYEEFADCHYQKKFVSKHGDCKYFINIYKYTFEANIAFPAKVQFYRGEDTFNIDLFYNPENNVADIERIIEHFWVVNCMDLDRHN